MVIIVDGLDCSGKSTVYDRLYQESKGMYFVRNAYPGPSDQERLDRLSLFKRRVSEPYIYVYDRATVIDDPVYEYMFNGRDSILEDLMDPSIFNNCLVIHFTVEKQEWFRRMVARGDQYVDIDKYDTVVNSYNRFYDKYKPRVEVIDTTSITPEQAYKRVLDMVNRFKEEMDNGL